ncbi:HEAT repeat domain-containing protein [Thermodesulfobacteriota bacterium]
MPPQDSIPSGIPKDTRTEIVKLYSEESGERSQAARQLGSMGERAKDAVPYLISRIADYPYVQNNMVAALEKIDPDWAKSEYAKRIVPEIIDVLDEEAKATYKDIDYFIEMITTPTTTSRFKNISFAVETLKDTRFVEPLIQMLSSKEQRYLFDPATETSWRPFYSRPILLLLDEIESDWGTRESAKKIIPVLILDLVNNSTKDSTESILNKIDPNWATSAAAKQVVPELISLLKDDKMYVKRGVPKVMEKIGDPRFIDPLIESLRVDEELSGNDLGFRQKSIRVLGDMGDSRVVITLNTFLNDKDTYTRIAAAMAIAKLGEKERMIEYVYKELKNDNYYAIEFLDEWNPDWRKSDFKDQILKGLARKLESDLGTNLGANSDKDVEHELVMSIFTVLRAIGDLGDENTINYLIKLFNDEMRFQKFKRWNAVAIRSRIVDTIGKIGRRTEDPIAADFLNNEYKDANNHFNFITSARSSLNEIKYDKMIKQIIEKRDENNKEVIDNILLLNDKDPFIREKAVKELIEKRSNLAIEPLVYRLRKEKYWDIKDLAAKALIDLGRPVAVHIINERRRLILDSNRYLRSRVQTMNDAEDSQDQPSDNHDVESLNILLNDKEVSVRLSAINKLGKLGDKRAIPSLLNVLKDEDLFVKKAAIEALGSFDDERIIEPLIQIVNNMDIESKSTSTSPYKYNYIIKVSNTDIKNAAIKALGRHNNKRVYDTIITTLSDEGPYIRISAVEALAKLNNKEAINSLITTLGDEHWAVRFSAAWALGELGDKQAVVPLNQFIEKEPYSDVKKAALEAIEKLK